MGKAELALGAAESLAGWFGGKIGSNLVRKFGTAIGMVKDAQIGMDYEKKFSEFAKDLDGVRKGVNETKPTLKSKPKARLSVGKWKV